MERTTKMREWIFGKRRAVTLDEVRFRYPDPEDDLRFLLEMQTITVTPEGFHALDGAGNLCAPGNMKRNDRVGHAFRTPGTDKGFRGHITTPSLASRASAGGKAPRRKSV